MTICTCSWQSQSLHVCASRNMHSSWVIRSLRQPRTQTADRLTNWASFRDRVDSHDGGNGNTSCACGGLSAGRSSSAHRYDREDAVARLAVVKTDGMPEPLAMTS